MTRLLTEHAEMKSAEVIEYLGVLRAAREIH